MRNIAYNMDCMDYMRGCRDKEFDLAIVDPPYGGGQGRLLAGVSTDTKKKMPA